MSDCLPCPAPPIHRWHHWRPLRHVGRIHHLHRIAAAGIALGACCGGYAGWRLHRAPATYPSISAPGYLAPLGGGYGLTGYGAGFGAAELGGLFVPLAGASAYASPGLVETGPGGGYEAPPVFVGRGAPGFAPLPGETVDVAHPVGEPSAVSVLLAAVVGVLAVRRGRGA